jgi:quinol monooxygenase YgiN
MFARIVEFMPKFEKKEELVHTVSLEVLPILKKQSGFLEILPFVPQNPNDKMIAVTLWTEKYEAEKYTKEVFPKVEAILKPYLRTPVTVKTYEVETKLCANFVEALATT